MARNKNYPMPKRMYAGLSQIRERESIDWAVSSK